MWQGDFLNQMIKRRKMKYLFRIFIFSTFAMSIYSCKNGGKNLNKQMDRNFRYVLSRNTNVVYADSFLIIDNWYISDYDLICISKNPPFFYEIDTHDFSLKKKYGEKGHAEGEWQLPFAFIIDKNRKLYIESFGGGKCIITSNNNIQKRVIQEPSPLNRVELFKFPIIGYAQYTSNNITWKLVNVENDQLIDSIMFVDTSKKGKAYLWDFQWNSYNNTIVMAHSQKECFSVINLDSNTHKIKDVTVYNGIGEHNEYSDFYAGVACSKDFIYLLSVRNVDLRTMSGKSDVEIYDYKGNAIGLIHIDILASRIIYDEANSQLLFTSMEDTMIHSLEL